MADPPRIIDAHVHLWDLAAHRYPFMAAKRDYAVFAGDTSSAFRTFLLPDLIAATDGLPVEKFVHIEAHWGTHDPAEETRWLQGIADARGNPHGIVGYAALHDPRVEELLAAHAACPNHRGIRHSINWHADRYYSMCDRPDYLTDPDWQRGYALLGKYGMSFDLQIFPHQLADAVALATRFPGVPLIVEHCAFPIDRGPDGRAQWRDGLRRLAELPNCTVKLSALVIMDHAWTKGSLAPIVRETVEIFGPDRTMFASNFPIDRVYIGYRDLVDAIGYAIADLSEAERDAVFYGTALRTYRL